MNARELQTVQAAFAHLRGDPAMQQKLFDALRDAVFAMDMSGASMQAEAPQAPACERIYQIRGAFFADHENAWCDATEAAFNMHPPKHRRIVCGIAPACERASMQAEAPQATKDAEDAARMDWILDRAVVIGGGNGFTLTVFVPHDSECIRTAIDAARKSQGEAP